MILFTLLCKPIVVLYTYSGLQLPLFGWTSTDVARSTSICDSVYLIFYKQRVQTQLHCRHQSRHGDHYNASMAFSSEHSYRAGRLQAVCSLRRTKRYASCQSSSDVVQNVSKLSQFVNLSCTISLIVSSNPLKFKDS